MHLKSLELSGFKSFAKKATLSFNTSITGIVGPNGSGKSNVVEAFRFVLGEQSIKSLRGKRGEDLIWNGGMGQSAEGRANRASVKLVFDNSSRMFPGVDFDEVTLERIVYRDNSNEYNINGSLVRLKDMVELLAGAHIGATGHHIISQGEADRILSASIRERREMVEDALGLKIYQWKRLESIRKLEKTDEHMKQVESLRREIAPHLKFLKRQVEKVEKAESMRKELVILYQEYFAHEEVYLTEEKATLTRELQMPQSELKELDRELAEAKKILTSSKGSDRRSQEIISLENKIAEIRGERDTITRELGRLEGEIAASMRAVEKEKEKQKRNELKTVYLRDVEEVVKGLESFETLQDARAIFSDIMKSLRDFIARHRTSYDSEVGADIEKDIDSLSKRRLDLEKKLKALSEESSELAASYDNLKRGVEKEKDTNREAEKNVFCIIARQNELRSVIAALDLRQTALIREEEAFKHELTEAGVIAGREAVNYATGGITPLMEKGGHNRDAQADRRKHIEKIKIRLEDAGAGGGEEVMKEYRETEERDVFLARELEDIEKTKKELLNLITDLEKRIDYEFKSGILKINSEFQKYFALMFGGGKAELTVVKEMRRRRRSDMEDLGETLSGGIETGELALEEEGPEGLEVNVSLPRKKVKGLMMLSGGERALTSIALLFAVSQVNPPPFIILDETDAALDEANSKKYGDMIENLSRQSQLILITHNRETMSRAGVLYGVTMSSDGASKLLSIAFEEAVQVAK